MSMLPQYGALPSSGCTIETRSSSRQQQDHRQCKTKDQRERPAAFSSQNRRDRPILQKKARCCISKQTDKADTTHLNGRQLALDADVKGVVRSGRGGHKSAVLQARLPARRQTNTSEMVEKQAGSEEPKPDELL